MFFFAESFNFLVIKFLNKSHKSAFYGGVLIDKSLKSLTRGKHSNHKNLKSVRIIIQLRSVIVETLRRYNIIRKK